MVGLWRAPRQTAPWLPAGPCPCPSNPTPRSSSSSSGRPSARESNGAKAEEGEELRLDRLVAGQRGWGVGWGELWSLVLLWGARAPPAHARAHACHAHACAHGRTHAWANIQPGRTHHGTAQWKPVNSNEYNSTVRVAVKPNLTKQHPLDKTLCTHTHALTHTVTRTVTRSRKQSHMHTLRKMQNTKKYIRDFWLLQVPEHH